MRLILASVFAALPVAVHAADLVGSDKLPEEYFKPPPSHVGPTVLIDGNGGYRWVKTDDTGGQDSPVISGAVRLNIPLHNALSLQLDADGEYDFTHEGSGDEIENLQGFWLTGAHASWRDPNKGLLGIFGAVGNGYNTGSTYDGGVGWMAGIEGQHYLGDLTLYGQGGFAHYPNDGDEHKESWFLRGLARWFVEADSLIEGEVTYGRTYEYETGQLDESGEFWTWGVKGKHRVAGSMYGVVGYRGGHYWSDDAGGETLDEHVLFAGISVVLGSSNLAANNLHGATLDLPARVAAVMQGID